MRIQHNIMAMNAYRNYTNNTSALSKNLEKLSSGYKINRAGDDAAGLAISEKMRAQITGLDVAQKNAKDGISLVQTAEGALTEVHDMLNRMYELAEQSANGTYQDDVDRDNLQAELNALRDEIDRISQSANFNGIKLFTQDGAAGDVATDVAVTLGTGAANGAALSDVSFAFASGASSEAKQALIDALGSSGAEISFKLSTGWQNNGKITLTGLPTGYTFTFGSQGGGEANVPASGVINIGGSSGKLDSNADLVLHMKGTDGKEVATLTIKKPAGATAGTSTITLAPKAAADASGAQAATLSTGSTAAAAGPEFTLASSAKTKFGIDSVDFAKAGLSITATTAVTMAFSSTGEKLTVTVGSGSKAVTFSTTLSKTKASLAGQTISLSDGNGKTISVTMATPTQLGTDGNTIAADTLGSLTPAASGDAGDGTDNDTQITLQIGEDGNTYNQLTFNKRGISTADLGIGSDSINIDTQKNALAALSSIKAAINTISSIRGDLGAIQNRLDHTINNLSVMQENIQDAESTIRDTDVADEMMAYTKNNILVQSAQAMLAQANQVPQGVLQLLQ